MCRDQFRPDDGDQVTPEMIEAGLEALRASGAVEHPISADRLVVEQIYRAMQAIAGSS
jgi:hypothetical protein